MDPDIKIDNDFLPDNIMEDCEILKYISTTLSGGKKIYTTKEFFSCHLEYPRLLKHMESEISFLESAIHLMNYDDEVKTAALFILNKKRDQLEQVIKNHKNLSIRRRNCAAEQLTEVSAAFKSSDHHRIQLMEIDSGRTTLIDMKQHDLLNTLLPPAISDLDELIKQNWLILWNESKDDHNALNKELRTLDYLCSKTLEEIKEKHCNTYDVILEKLRKARTKRLGQTRAFVFKTENYWTATTLFCLFRLWMFESFEPYRAITILYYISVGIICLRLFVPSFIIWANFCRRMNECSEAILYIAEALVEARLHYEGTACSEFNVKYYLSMESCKETELHKLPTEVLDQLRDSDKRKYKTSLSAYLSLQDATFAGIQAESVKLTGRVADIKEKIIKAKGLNGESWHMQIRELNLSIESYEEAIQWEIDRLSSMKMEYFSSTGFSRESLLMTEFQSHLELMRQQNSEVVRQLLEFKQSLIDRHEPIIPKLRRWYYLESFRGRISTSMLFCSGAVLLLFAVFRTGLRDSNDIREKLIHTEKMSLNLEVSFMTASVSTWIIIVFQGVFHILHLIDCVLVCYDWYLDWQEKKKLARSANLQSTSESDESTSDSDKSTSESVMSEGVDQQREDMMTNSRVSL
ncbi:hypothetical protein PUMCH_002584 [Australozyma saopauloensis]|uniref:Uncharacterized protein n=1 Tax=Australozyma saopauloensis TaxID=291208 RepID=A0AAX4H9S5_9ASCO|nr:hypothetical protein PUMCH_002584 [[Candida] saopauloensis]